MSLACRALTGAIAELLDNKRQAPELGLSHQVPVIHRFIKDELARLETMTPGRDGRTTPLPMLNALFHAVLREHPPVAR